MTSTTNFRITSGYRSPSTTVAHNQFFLQLPSPKNGFFSLNTHSKFYDRLGKRVLESGWMIINTIYWLFNIIIRDRKWVWRNYEICIHNKRKQRRRDKKIKHERERESRVESTAKNTRSHKKCRSEKMHITDLFNWYWRGRC